MKKPKKYNLPVKGYFVLISYESHKISYEVYRNDEKKPTISSFITTNKPLDDSEVVRHANNRLIMKLSAPKRDNALVEMLNQII